MLCISNCYICKFTKENAKIYKFNIPTMLNPNFSAILKNLWPWFFKFKIRRLSEGTKKPNPHEF